MRRGIWANEYITYTYIIVNNVSILDDTVMPPDIK
jgi:hypothetical protein